jgi:hypothetical protein
MAEQLGGAEILPGECKATWLGLAVLSISPMAEWSNYEEDERAAGFLQAYYKLAAAQLATIDGRIVDFMADVIVAVYPWRSSAEVVPAITELSEQVVQAAIPFRLDASMNANLHLGVVIEGTFGPPGQARPGIVGKALEVVSRLERNGITVTGEVFNALSKETQRLFHRIPSRTTLFSLHRMRQDA